MNLTLFWQKPASRPSCDYKVLYRRKGDVGYTNLSTSGSTSGMTSGTCVIAVSAPANYEGYIQSDCCSGDLSAHDPFGVNAYQALTVVISVQANPLHYLATVTSTYPNPYSTALAGHFTSSAAGTVNFTATYSSGATSQVIVLSNTPLNASEIISGTVVGTPVSNFNNGGQLQAFDPIQTPPYFQFYSSGTTAWNGNPAVLPSFTLDSFNVTETDTNGNVLAGNLLMSWAQGATYSTGTHPYNTVTFIMYEHGKTTQLGTVTFDATIHGLRNITLPAVKGTSAMATSTQYTLNAYWADDTLISSSNFYLPSF